MARNAGHLAGDDGGRQWRGSCQYGIESPAYAPTCVSVRMRPSKSNNSVSSSHNTAVQGRESSRVDCPHAGQYPAVPVRGSMQFLQVLTNSRLGVCLHCAISCHTIQSPTPDF